MGDNLPLIPEKKSICADVRPIIRAVFRELDYLAPLTTMLPAPVVNQHLSNVLAGDQAEQWIEKYRSECKEIWTREGELKDKHARRISREPLPNIYKLCSPQASSPAPAWKLDRGLIDRRDLVPTIQQNAGRDGSLWIKNILNRSSGDISSMTVVGRSLHQPPTLLMAADDEFTLQTLSIGAVETRPSLPPPAPPPPLPQPDYILCVPSQLDFINFTIGHLHTQGIRIVNVSKFVVRLSVRPPKRRELDLELCSPRGLTVTSGAAAELRVHFRPNDVRELRDTLLIRVSMGRSFMVPITCYMQPPVLHILVPSVTTSVLTCTPGEQMACKPLLDGDVLELGARLLGDVHCARVLLHCDADHASFFMLTEDAWFSFSLDCLTSQGSVIAGPFVLWPAWWGGGGAVRGCAWCRAECAGLHAAALRLLSSTAVVRHLHMLADVLLFRPDHLTIVAQEKDFDICGEGESTCEYYVHLGTTFPHRSLSATVQLINHSPVVYSYYWSVRPWGVCSCWEDEKEADGALGPEDDSERLCSGAKQGRFEAEHSPETYESKSENARLLRVEPARGQIMPRSTCALHVHVPNAGERLGVQRAVLMLILKDIPKESFPPNYEPMVVSREEVMTDPIPGVESESHEVCELVCAQMEVWWDVAPVRFVLDPPVLSLYHSRRLDSVMVDIAATQLFGSEGACVTWQVPAGVPLPAPLSLTPVQSCNTTLRYRLPSLPNDFPETDVITMVAANEEWRSQCTITRQCATRHPSLQPARAWLGVVAPGAHMLTKFQLLNDTHQQTYWWASAFRWWGENPPSPACLGRRPCERCRVLTCTCGLLKPARGALRHNELAEICYEVNAPQCDGCVATLVQARRTGADVAAVPGAAGSRARAALVAYRVLAPRLVLRLLPCSQQCMGSGCKLDAGSLRSERGTATLRPLQALTLGRSTCYRLRLTNITPLPTCVHFHRDSDAMDVLTVKFSPNDFRMRPYGEIEVRVVLKARRVCGRRLFVYRGSVEHAYMPVYLVIDTAIHGVKVSCEVPLGGALQPDSFVIMPRIQKEEFPWEVGKPKPSTPEEIFAAEDYKRLFVTANRCSCPFEMKYIPPVRRPEPPPHDIEEEPPVEIVWTPPPLTRVCACDASSKANVPEFEQPVCLQFTAVPLRTVRTRTLHLRNESVVTAHWSTAVRRWPRTRHRTLAADQWARDVAAPGVALQCAPAGGVLAAHADVLVRVQVYSDCWGLYYDQLLVQIESVEPIILDVWMEVVGPPLHLAIKPAHQYLDVTPTMRMSRSVEARVLRGTNTSRAALLVHAYTAACYEYPQDVLPFRLYLRYYDVLPRTCPCLTAFQCDAEELALTRCFYTTLGRISYESDLIDEQSDSCSIIEEVDTGFEIYLAPDCGPQNDEHYTVSPEVRTVLAGESVDWQLTPTLPLHDGEHTPDVNLLLRLQPIHYSGSGWQRPEPPPQVVRLRQVVRCGHLKLSCRELRVKLCALDLPYGEVLRVRKRFRIMNVGSGVLELGVKTEAPWCVVQELAGAAAEEAAGARPTGRGPCGAGCGCTELVATRHAAAPLRLQPSSSTEMCVEVAVSAAQAWPAWSECAAAAGACLTPVYPPRIVAATPLHFYNDNYILKTVSLLLDLEYPVLHVQPPSIDFGVVTDGDTRKTYFSVSHSSRSGLLPTTARGSLWMPVVLEPLGTVTLDVATHCLGSKEFEIWPPFLRIPPGGSANVYLLYTATWRSAPAEGCVHVYVCCGAGLAAPRDLEEGAGAECAAQLPARRTESGAWCRAAVAVRATPARDHNFHLTRHDHTDEPRLLPPDI